MAEHHPTAAELARAVIDFLEHPEEPPGSARAAYLGRVALGCLRILERELRLGAASDAQQAQRLHALLGRDGTLPELEAELGARIRRRQLDWHDARLLRHLEATVREQLAIDNPEYSGLREAIARRGGPSTEPT